MTLPTGSDRRGVTLLELVLVLALLALVAAYAAPQLARFLSGQSLRSECARFIAASRLARSEAITRGARSALWVVPSEGVYGVDVSGAPGEPAAARTFTLDADFQLVFEETIEAEPAVLIAYRPDGTTEDTPMMRLWIEDRHGAGYQIALSESQLHYEIYGYDKHVDHLAESN